MIFTRSKGEGLPAVVWDPARGRPLFTFQGPRLETHDPELAKKLTSMGYRRSDDQPASGNEGSQPLSALRKRAKAAGVKGYTRMDRGQLLECLGVVARQSAEEPLPPDESRPSAGAKK